MTTYDIIKENQELKEKLAKLQRERESQTPFLCSDPKCKERKTPSFCECGRIINK